MSKKNKTMSPQAITPQAVHVKNVIDTFVAQIDTLGIRQLEQLYIRIIEEIFGLRGKPGLKLNDIEYFKNPIEYDIIFKFLHPVGPFFKLCYKLIYEVNAHYEYPIHDLPFTVQQEIKCQSSCSSYYRQKLHFKEETMEPAFFLLNPFEYYMFYFMVYLVLYDKNTFRVPNFFGDKREIHQRSTLYLRLCEEYISIYLPFDDTPILPVIKCPIRIHVGDTRTVLSRTSTILRTDLVSKLLDTHDACESPVEDIWRSYLIAHVAIDFWGSTPSQQSRVCDPNYTSLPSATNICAYRYLLKHLHIFSNSAGRSSSKMDEFKRGTMALFQSKIYKFLKNTMVQWPHDSTFTLILETWLTFIQPWRYTVPRKLSALWLSPSSSLESNTVNRKWLKFISDNLLFYTYIFQLVLKRFENLNLLLQKNSSMLLRILKVYAKSNLSMMVEEIEQRYLTEYIYNRTKWSDSITNHICAVENPAFEYIPMFSPDYMIELKPLLKIIYHSREEALKQISVLRSIPRNRKMWLRQFFLLDYDSKEQDEIIGDFERLATALQLFSSVFHFSQAIFEKECTDEGLAKCEVLVRNVQKRIAQSSFHTDFNGNPDIQPIRSYEIGFLVRILYKISTNINEQYGDSILTAYNAEGYLGRLVRSLLAPPQQISIIDKDRGIYKPLVQKIMLPPRVSLRMFGHQLIYIYFGIITIFCKLLGIPLGTVYSYIMFVISAFILIRPFFRS